MGLVFVSYHTGVREPLLHSLQAHPATLFCEACWPAHILCDKSVDQSKMAVGKNLPMRLRIGGGWRLCWPTYFSAGRDLGYVELGWRVLYKSLSVRLYRLSSNKEALFFVNTFKVMQCRAFYLTCHFQHGWLFVCNLCPEFYFFNWAPWLTNSHEKPAFLRHCLQICISNTQRGSLSNCSFKKVAT